eukprot:600180-Karenia_brevis.AAC.1
MAIEGIIAYDRQQPRATMLGSARLSVRILWLAMARFRRWGCSAMTSSLPRADLATAAGRGG